MRTFISIPPGRSNGPECFKQGSRPLSEDQASPVPLTEKDGLRGNGSLPKKGVGKIFPGGEQISGRAQKTSKKKEYGIRIRFF